ncbi:MAG: 6-carboxytetrahydropterin synthase [Gemmatimonadetes bacterium]|nr:6-carboxytetrahydropterin synthase [Gemmatimonadota bacterium]
MRFTATHRYWRPEWDDARNRATFGACAAPEPHGHDYACDVTVGGEIPAKTGMVIDLAVLDRVLNEEIVAPLHGRSLNDAVAEFAAGARIPTCEELARLIATRVGNALVAARTGALVLSVRVAEDDSLSASWTER